MKSVLISIQPKWVEKIANGEKTIEVRKTIPKIETPFKCYIYMSQGDLKDLGSYSEWIYKNRMKVIGEFICDNIDEYTSNERGWYCYDLETCLRCDEIAGYGKGKTLYGWHISDIKIYDKPKPIMQFYKPCPIEWKNCPVCEFYSKNAGTCMNNIDRPPQSWLYVDELE